MLPSRNKETNLQKCPPQKDICSNLACLRYFLRLHVDSGFLWCYYAVKLIKTVEVASIKSSNRMCRTHVKIVERERRRRNGSSEEPGPGHTINNRMTVIPKGMGSYQIVC